MTIYKISCVENDHENPISQRSLFLIQPLQSGHGITLGNALRRSLLSDLTGYSISSFSINNLEHEFVVAPYLKEDAMEIMLNLKQIVFKALPSYSLDSEFLEASNQKLKAVLNIKGPRIVTASMLLLPYPYLTLLNPNQYICTITNESSLYLEIEIEKGKAYELVDNMERSNELERTKGGQARKLLTDRLYSPVKNVNYKVKLVNDSIGNIREALLLDITTNGSISPKRALQEACKVLLDLFAPILLTETYENLDAKIFEHENQLPDISQVFKNLLEFDSEEMETLQNLLDLETENEEEFDNTYNFDLENQENLENELSETEKK